LDVSDIPLSLRKNPFRTITDWSEERFKLVGRRVFPTLCLMPQSLIIPPIPYTDMPIRSNIHCLFLSPPGGAKSCVSKTYADIALNPMRLKSFTSAAIEEELMQSQGTNVSLIVDDMSTIARDRTLLKTLEGALGEEKEVSRVTATKSRRFDVNLSALFCGVPDDLTSYLTSGFIFRVSPIMLIHNKEDQDKIGEKIVGSIGNNSFSEGGINIKDVRNFYRYLAQIQEGDGSIPTIKGYDFSKIDKTQIYLRWQDTRTRVNVETRYNWYRELFSGFRYMCSYSFLNIFSRNVVKDAAGNNLLQIEPEDLQFGIRMMAQEIRVKQKILTANDTLNKAKNVKELIATIEKDKGMDDLFKEIIKLFATNKD
jgi:hypothetical protein